MPRTVKTTLLALLVLATFAVAKNSERKIDLNDLSFYRPSTTTEPYALTSDGKVRNVILCIGDGMGVNQVALASMKAAGLGGKLYMERLPVSGLVRTHSADSSVTDSAAAGTALATGIKTRNGMIGMCPEERAYWTILEAAKARGMATGLVATSNITHATPASFAAHVKSRRMEDKIAEHLLANKVNVLFGGGRKFFLPRSDPHSARRDDRNLIAAARNAGYKCIEPADELASFDHRQLLGLFQIDILTTTPPEPSLALLTEKALQALKHGDCDDDDAEGGHFLMVEGSQIDWTCHANDARATVRQILLFDQAVKVADVFVRINSEGVELKQADFILTLIRRSTVVG